MSRICVFVAAICFGVADAQAQIDDDALVDLKTIDKSIVVDLRYATKRNIAGRPLYPRGTRCIVRRSVAERLRYAQHLLRQRGYGLKVWDAYRPVYAQQILFELIRNPNFIADPKLGGSVHSWGAAVDATLVDLRGREMRMPTDFDDITPAASMFYQGEDATVARNLGLLQGAMGSAGFYGTRPEWWHFIAKDWMRFGPVTALAADPVEMRAAKKKFRERFSVE